MINKAFGMQLLVTLMAVAVMLFAYHRFIMAPSVRIGVVDVSEVYRLKEKQILEVVTRQAVTDDDKQKAVTMALEFTKSLPAALEQLPRECSCFVLVRSAVAAETPNMIDLTPLLRSKIGV